MVLLAFETWLIVMGDCPVHCRIFNSILGFNQERPITAPPPQPLPASPPVVTVTKSVCRHFQMTPEDRITPCGEPLGGDINLVKAHPTASLIENSNSAWKQGHVRARGDPPGCLGLLDSHESRLLPLVGELIPGKRGEKENSRCTRNLLSNQG